MFTIEEARQAVAGRSEFAVKETADTVCFDYIVVLQDTFTPEDCSLAAQRKAWVRRNFRGVTFCRTTGELLSLPFHKFYNINQNPDSQFDRHKTRAAAVYEKLDGSMIHFYVCKGLLKASTCRSSETLQAKEALAFVQKNPALEALIWRSIGEGYTPIFEWVAPHNQIVVRYQQVRLVYLISRHRQTGLYRYEEAYPDRAQVYNIKFCDILNNIDRQEFEGYVCHLDNGEIFKVKTPWYLERHRAVEYLMKPLYKLYGVALDGFMDDLIAMAADSYKPKLTAIYAEVQQDLLAVKTTSQNQFDGLVASLGVQHASLADRLADKAYRKRFAMAAIEQKFNIPVMMMLFDGRDPDAVLKSDLLKRYTAQYPEKIWSENELSI